MLFDLMVLMSTIAPDVCVTDPWRVPPGPLGCSVLPGREAREGARGALKRTVVASGNVGPNLSAVYTEVKGKVPDVAGPFASWRVVSVHDLEVFQGRLLPHLSLADPTVRSWLSAWHGPAYAQPGPAGVELTLSRRARPRRRERWWLHLLLFLLTLGATTLAGAMLVPGDPLRLRMAGEGALAIPVPTRMDAAALAGGLWFSLPLCFILGMHELGHYAAARRHAMDVSPPYFVPAPWFVNLIGTFGAFIRLRSPLLNRAVLLDVGAAGPLASFALSVPAVVAGLAMSEAAPAARGGGRLGLAVFGDQLALGESAAFAALRTLSPVADAPFVLLHPLAFAGWLGLFFTALNLFPVGQLDGGHVAYALSGTGHRIAGFATLGLLLVLSFQWYGWLFWGMVILVFGRGRLAHPPVFDPAFRLSPRRRAVAWACVAIFLLTLVPVPFAL